MDIILSSKIVTEEFFLKDDFKYFIYSTADLLIPKNIFSHIESMKEFNSSDECCALVYPNILKNHIKSLEKNMGKYLWGL